ncbi:hypothetical protein JCM5296_003433 [Sporobolomyces johnsonii]
MQRPSNHHDDLFSPSPSNPSSSPTERLSLCTPWSAAPSRFSKGKTLLNTLKEEISSQADGRQGECSFSPSSSLSPTGERDLLQQLADLSPERVHTGLFFHPQHTVTNKENVWAASHFSLSTPPQSPPVSSQQSRHPLLHHAALPTPFSLISTPLTPPADASARAFSRPSSFDPVVGSTPTRPRRHHMETVENDSLHQLGAISLPCTPAKSGLPSSMSPMTGTPCTDAKLDNSRPNQWPWTWPPRSSVAADGVWRSTGPAFEEGPATTPTRKVNVDSPTLMLVNDETPSLPSKELATRYVLVQGVERGSTENDIRELLVKRCKSLSIKGCFTALLRTHGVVVLVFHDVRHALAALRLFSSSAADPASRSFSPSALLDARCITRDTFEQLHTCPTPNPLLSPSEAVLVFTLRGPTSTPYFTPLPLLASFGEIRSIKLVEEHLHVVEYWDDRCAQTGLEVLDGRETGGARFGCSFEPGVASVVLPSEEAPASILPPPAPIAPAPKLRVHANAAPFSPVASPCHSAEATSLTALQVASAFCIPPSPHNARPSAGPLGRRDVNETYGSGYWPFEVKQSSYGPRCNEQEPVKESGSRFALGYGEQPGMEQPSLTKPLDPVQNRDSASPRGQPLYLHAASPPACLSPAALFPDQAPSPLKPPSNALSHPAWSSSAKHESRLSTKFGIVRDDKIPAGNVLNFERIEQGLDMRTTLMLKNIPNKLKDYEVMNFIEEASLALPRVEKAAAPLTSSLLVSQVVGRAFDFFYLRCDYSNNCNVGYGFVNFTTTTALLAYAKARLGTRWNMCGSDKLCVMSYANIQGKESLINHFKNSSVLDQDESRRPKVFVSSGPNAGEPEAFPMCDDPVRKARSAANAANVGLFPSQKPVFKITQALTGMHI